MKIVQSAIRYPVTTTVGVLFLVLFGMLAIFRIPVQMSPDVDEPIISVSTTWPGASPREIEREIVEEQEEQLKSLEGLRKMESSCSDSRGSITLTFYVGTDIDAAILKVSNRLEQVPSYPSEADKPVITTGNIFANAIGWFILRPTEENGFEGDISTLFDYADNVIKPAFERVSGVSGANIYGGRTREMQVIVDPARLATRQVTLGELATALDRENKNYSGGDFDEGKRRYIVRTVGEYETAEDIESIVIAVRNGLSIYLRDVGRAELGYRKAGARVFQNGRPVLAINAVREPGSNVLDVMTRLQEVMGHLDETELTGRGLHLIQVYDETEYIVSAISLVRQSLIIGGALAILILLLYLRSFTSTFVIAAAIPVSVVGVFLMMYWFGRTINVVSLAGMAFAIGMVVDNSIVVLENIYRHRQMGKSRRDAAHDGASEVWGAVLASTLTTIAVFVPVLFIREEVGQLFGDIAIAISCAVAFSLVVAVTVIPSLSAKILGTENAAVKARSGFKDLWGGAAIAGRINRWIADTVYRITGSNRLRITLVAGLVVLSIGGSLLLAPDTEYLPAGNRNFLFGFLLPPPGYNLNEVSDMESVFSEQLSYLWEAPADTPETDALPGGGIESYFFVALNSNAFMGARSRSEERSRELLPEFRKVNAKLPGTIFVMNQAGIFSGVGGRSIDLEIRGPDLEHLLGLGGEIFGKVMQNLPGAQARPIPGLDLGNPEVQVRTHRRRAAELGISNRELGYAVSVLVDGAKASEFQYQGDEIDLRLTTENSGAHRTHLLEELPIATRSGELVTLGSVADITLETGPTTINRSERQRTITIRVSPSDEMPLERAMKTIESEILAPMRESGRLGGLYRVELSGTADKLAQTWSALKWNLLLALVITFLLLSALFENFIYPFVIMFSVPLAAFGGFLGLAILTLFTPRQSLDVLTMLGFIILIGTVVNNAILIVHQTLHHIRTDGMSNREAIREAVRNRVRPIFMSVSTSVFGMLPLVIFPGAGSELYRGLGSVVVGGLIVSTLFTLFLVPALLSMMLDVRAAAEIRIRSIFQGTPGPEDGATAP